MLDYETLKFCWWLIIGFLFIGFVVTDGMDMGVGGLLLFVAKTDLERRVVINTVGPHWDGNQVWFITAAAALFAAWPMVYATAFSGFYFAMMLTLFALFLRPLAFDYRSKIESTRWRFNWDRALFVGSMVPALVFGIAFGNLLQGVPFSFDELMRVTYTGSFLALFNPFALLSGVVSVSMLLLHGATWLNMRTEGDIAKRSAKAGQLAAAVMLSAFAICGVMIAQSIDGFVVVSGLDPSGLAQPTKKIVELSRGAWLNNFNNMPLLWLSPIISLLMALLAALILRFAANRFAGIAFMASALNCALVIVTAASAMFPFVLPSISFPNHSLTMWDSVSSEYTLRLMLVVVAIFIPIIITYTAWCYRRMWRTVTVQEIEQHSHTAY
ncbi:MAG: cytochrome d ubiquinol oxidase subunit II [Psychrobium sp.]|nr:cytochrome d ubiquinol oxidase subunit II [Psychrobium sp.]